MFAFVDESGYPRPTDPTRRPTLAAVCVRPSDLRRMSREIYRMKERIWGPNGPELHGARLIRERTMRDESKMKVVNDAISILPGTPQLAVFSVVMFRPDQPIPDAPSRVGYQYFHLIRRVHLYADQIYRRESGGTALLLFDERDAKQDRQLSEAILNLLYGTQHKGLLNRILEMPVFVDSSVTPGVQLADLVASIIRVYHEADLDTRSPASSFETWIATLYQEIQGKTRDFPGTEAGAGRTYGIYRMSPEVFRSQAPD